MSIAFAIAAITSVIAGTAAGIVSTAVSISVPFWHTAAVASSFVMAVFPTDAPAVVFGAVARTLAVQKMDTAAVAMRDATATVSKSGTAWDKTGNTLPDATALKPPAVLPMADAMPLLRDVVTTIIDAAYPMPVAAPVFKAAAVPADYFTSKGIVAIALAMRASTFSKTSTSNDLPTLFPARSSMVVCTSS